VKVGDDASKNALTKRVDVLYLSQVKNPKKTEFHYTLHGIITAYNHRQYQISLLQLIITILNRIKVYFDINLFETGVKCYDTLV